MWLSAESSSLAYEILAYIIVRKNNFSNERNIKNRIQGGTSSPQYEAIIETLSNSLHISVFEKIQSVNGTSFWMKDITEQELQSGLWSFFTIPCVVFSNSKKYSFNLMFLTHSRSCFILYQKGKAYLQVALKVLKDNIGR